MPHPHWKTPKIPAFAHVMTHHFFQVRVCSLGWVELSEDMLTSENSSKAVNRCIVQLSSPTSCLQPDGMWGGGRELLLELCDGALRLIDLDNGQVCAYLTRVGGGEY